jgi:uncharacterized protein DUF4232
MRRWRLLLAVSIAAVACGETSSAALSGQSSTPALVTPTPWPSVAVSPVACGDLPPEKCAISQRYDAEQRQARSSWSAQVLRSYSPIPAVPFVASTPRPTAPPATPTREPSVRQCSARDLVGAYSGDNGAGGTNLRVVAIANTSDTPCGIRGKPSVTILVANRLAEATYAQPADGPVAILPADVERPTPGEPPRPGQLWLTVGFSRSCSSVASWMSTLVVTMPGDGSTLRIDLPSRNLGQPASTPLPSASCQDGPYFPQIGTWDLGVVEPPVPPAPGLALRAVANAPGIAVAGEPFRFEVTITNESDSALTLEPCPNYSISIGGGEDRRRNERHALDCASIGRLAPHGASTFAMEIGVPEDWPVTLDGSLIWVLESSAAGLKLPLGIARRA